MAKLIDLDFEWPEGKKIPKIKLTFKKDPELFGFMKRSKDTRKKKQGSSRKDKEVQEVKEKMDYSEKCFLGTAIIKYGEDATTLCKCDTVIEALKDDIDKFYYHNNDSEAKIKCISGFLDTNSGFKKFRDFDSWDTTSSKGSFLGAHRIILPINRLKKGEKKKLQYDLQLFGRYLECLSSSDRVSHAFFFRMNSDTNGAVLLFKIPVGKYSEVYQFDLQIIDNGKILFKESYKDLNNNVFTVGEKFGNAWVKMDKKYIHVFWSIPSTLERGYICRLDWFNQRKRGD
ncbi:hypothetical protein JW766_03090 [Candidatus Dojkabacteria bacterium]|nr:hypothetical protein [Candidatus Dojkabacteria bacterium]